jgi:hypothetical protein
MESVTYVSEKMIVEDYGVCSDIQPGYYYISDSGWPIGPYEMEEEAAEAYFNRSRYN